MRMNELRTMGDLISRSALLHIVGQMPLCWEYGQAVSDIYKIIKEQPAVDAEPVRHGRWIDHGDYVTTAYGSLDVKVCSNCNAEVTLDHYDYYCPNCGAKMDAEVNDHGGDSTEQSH